MRGILAPILTDIRRDRRRIKALHAEDQTFPPQVRAG